jgi:hypothetical protein
MYMANGTKVGGGETKYRDYLAIGITCVSIVGVVLLAFTIIWRAQDPSATAQLVLNSVLPLLGVWVGTVLAYYFSRENFEAATRSVTELAKQISPQEKLTSTPAKGKMIPKDQIHVETVTAAKPADQTKLVDMLNRLKAFGRGLRIPVLTDNDYPKYVIHRSTIDNFLTRKAMETTPPPDLGNFTLKDLIDDPELGKTLPTSFASVKETATLADAKDAMDKTPGCQDVFVTAGGTPYEPVSGWITNTIIEDSAKV